MSAIRNKGNWTTELAFSRLLHANKITDWCGHNRHIAGVPDFVFQKQKLQTFQQRRFSFG